MQFTQILYNGKKAIAKHNAIEKQIKEEKQKLSTMEEKLLELKKDIEKQKQYIGALENTNFELGIDIELFYAQKHNYNEEIEEIWKKRNEYMKNRKYSGSCWKLLLDKEIYKIVKGYTISNAQYEKIKKTFIY